MRARRAPSALRDFVKMHREVEGVLQRVGRGIWDLVLIDVRGDWVRDELESEEEAEAACLELGIRMHRGWDDPRMVRRIGGRDDWNDPSGRRRAL